MDTTAEQAGRLSYGSDPQDAGSQWLHVDTVVEPETGTARLALTGELDRTTAAHLRDSIAEVLRGSTITTVVIEAPGLSFLDSSGIRGLLTCRTAAAAARARLIVTDPGPILYQVLAITGLLDMFGIPEQTNLSSAGHQQRRTAARLVDQDGDDAESICERSARLRQESQELRTRAAAMRRNSLDHSMP